MKVISVFSCKGILIAVCILLYKPSFAGGDSLYIHGLLLQLEQYQSKNNNKFTDGLFSSWREYAQHKNEYKADQNVFYTGLIVFTLRKYYHLLPLQDQQICDRIFKNAIPVFAIFKNRRGRPTYNFWRTDNPEVFPNSGFLNLFNKTENLPDDADDTVISLLALGAPDSVARQVHELLGIHSNSSRLKIKNTYAGYRHLPAYSTWVGEKMPIDFDICVLSNILYFVNHYQLSWSAQDSASFQLIRSVVMNKQHLTNAAYIAPHYHRPVVVVYHLARTLSLIKGTSADSLRTIILHDINDLFQSSNDLMDKVILNSALMYLHKKPLPMQIPAIDQVAEVMNESDFVFFIADMGSLLSNYYKKVFSKTALLRFNYYCPAYNIALLFECVLLQREMDS